MLKVSFLHTRHQISRAAVLGRTLVLTGAVFLIAVDIAGCSDSSVLGVNSGSERRPTAGTGSGNMVMRRVEMRDFSEIEASAPVRVEITRGESYAVSVSADDNVIDHVRITNAAQVLRIEMKGASFHNASVRVVVTMPDIRAVRIAGASTATLSGFKPRQLTAEVAGASRLTGRLDGGELDVSVMQASNLNLGGQAETLRLMATGASTGGLGDLAVGRASVSLRDASSATVNARDRLDADLRGASSLYYVGNPSLGSIASVEASSLRRR